MNPRARASLVTAAASVLFVVACGADGGRGPEDTGNVAGKPGPNPSSSQSAQTSPAGPVLVPNFVADRVRAAAKGVLALGLRPRMVRGFGTACRPNHTVVRQRPAAGTEVEVGTRVRLVINVNTHLGECGLGLPPASKDLRRVVDLFTAFARAPHSPRLGLRVVTPVELFVGGELHKVIPAVRITDRKEWETCPEGGYAARSCPISPLIPFVTYPGTIAVTTQAPAHLCVPAWELPERLNVYRSVTLTPDEGRDCTSYFAVQLFVNDVGQIVAVHLVLSDP